MIGESEQTKRFRENSLVEPNSKNGYISVKTAKEDMIEIAQDYRLNAGKMSKEEREDICRRYDLARDAAITLGSREDVVGYRKSLSTMFRGGQSK
ncbi:MAG: hypothetical protein ABIB79_03190 [archaeon]